MTLPLCKKQSPIKAPMEKTLMILWHMTFGMTQRAKGNFKKTMQSFNYMQKDNSINHI